METKMRLNEQIAIVTGGGRGAAQKAKPSNSGQVPSGACPFRFVCGE